MATGIQQARIAGLLGAGIVVAFFLPWTTTPSAWTGLELVAVATELQQTRGQAILLVLYGAIPVAGLLTVAAALLRHGVRIYSGLCGLLSVAGIGLLILARAQVESLAAVGVGAYVTGGLALALLSIAFNLVRLA
ncbi:MAG: hypothetical protein GDA41_02905 [Rhodospirillales bacterium]|nr:hypothetical protein [Rhodospirillales bacterium]